MSYISLYRKYRPENFANIVGQNHIMEILKSQIVNDKVSHAYIFSGSRGTGKTTAAKVFAKALNCLNRKGAEPCNECEACKTINSGSTTDVVEMDAASNNSVDDIRAIKQEVIYATTGLKYKVYIIDEVHMLSSQAFNALLKTLEEPPKNVVFILATTAEHKIIPTILSRCMRFEFKKIEEEDIVNRLEYIIKDIKQEADKEALKYIAKLSSGGLRDAISILERTIDETASKITYTKVENLIGAVNKEVLEVLSTDILKYNAKAAMETTEKIIKSGKDIRHICTQLVDVFIDQLTTLAISENKEKIEVSIFRLNHIIKELSKLDSDIRQSINSDIIFKSKIIELCTLVTYSNEKELLEKIGQLELRLEKLEKSKEQKLEIIDKEIYIETKEIEKEKLEKIIDKPVQNIEIKKELKEDKEQRTTFKDIEKLKLKLHENDDLNIFSALTGSNAYKLEDCICFETENNFAYCMLRQDVNKEILKKTVADITGENINVKIEYKEKVVALNNSFEEHMKGIDTPFTIID